MTWAGNRPDYGRHTRTTLTTCGRCEATAREVGYVVPLIKKYLRTPEQKAKLDAFDITIEDCLNGRVAGEVACEFVYCMFAEWNAKLGTEHFGG